MQARPQRKASEKTKPNQRTASVPTSQASKSIIHSTMLVLAVEESENGEKRALESKKDLVT
jgi:hypothetical protein